MLYIEFMMLVVQIDVRIGVNPAEVQFGTGEVLLCRNLEGVRESPFNLLHPLALPGIVPPEDGGD